MKPPKLTDEGLRGLHIPQVFLWNGRTIVFLYFDLVQLSYYNYNKLIFKLIAAVVVCILKKTRKKKKKSSSFLPFLNFSLNAAIAIVLYKRLIVLLLGPFFSYSLSFACSSSSFYGDRN